MLEAFKYSCIQASSTYSKIFEVLNDYLDGTRKKSSFSREILILGSGLGLCHHALAHFGKLSMGLIGIVNLLPIFAGNYDLADGSCRSLRRSTMPIGAIKILW